MCPFLNMISIPAFLLLLLLPPPASRTNNQQLPSLTSTNCYPPFITHHLTSTHCHPPIVIQPISTNQLSPTKCHHTIINQLSLTKRHQPIMICLLVNCLLQGVGCTPFRRCSAVICVRGVQKQCVLQGFVGVDDP